MRWSSIAIIDQSHGSVKFVHTPFVHLSPNNALNSRFGASYLLCPFWLSVADWRFSYESRHQFSFHFCVTALCRIRCLRRSLSIEHGTTWNQGLSPKLQGQCAINRTTEITLQQPSSFYFMIAMSPAEEVPGAIPVSGNILFI